VLDVDAAAPAAHHVGLDLDPQLGRLAQVQHRAENMTDALFAGLAE
jgi:hypothetical protein